MSDLFRNVDIKLLLTVIIMSKSVLLYKMKYHELSISSWNFKSSCHISYQIWICDQKLTLNSYNWVIFSCRNVLCCVIFLSFEVWKNQAGYPKKRTKCLQHQYQILTLFWPLRVQKILFSNPNHNLNFDRV